MLLGCFVLAIKDKETLRKVWRERSIVQGYLDNMKKSLLHNIVVPRQFTTKLIVGLVSTLDFTVFSTDVNHEHFQSNETLQRNIYISNLQKS